MTKIEEALGQLDAGNDQHWTADGLPRIETVRFLSGDPSVGRDEITKAAPGYSRNNRVLGNVQAAQAEQAAQSGAGAEQGANAPYAGDTPAANGGEDGQVQQEDEEGFARILAQHIPDDAPLEAKLLAAQNVVAKIEQEIVRASRFRDQAIKEVDRLVHKLHGGRGHEQHSGAAIRAYLTNQAQELANRAEAQKQIRESGVDLTALARMSGGAPIDRAMARKTGHGAMRPVFNVAGQK